VFGVGRQREAMAVSRRRLSGNVSPIMPGSLLLVPFLHMPAAARDPGQVHQARAGRAGTRAQRYWHGP